MDHWLRMVLSKAALQPHNTHGNVHDPVYLEWEALSQVIVEFQCIQKFSFVGFYLIIIYVSVAGKCPLSNLDGVRKAIGPIWTFFVRIVFSTRTSRSFIT